MGKLHTNVIGFDDAPFARDHRGDVLLVGTVCSRTRLDGIVSGHVRRDGANSTAEMIRVIEASQFSDHIQAVLLQGIAVAGFNVVDVHALHAALGVPVVAIVRKQPDFASIRRALDARVRGADRKWRLIQRAGPLDPIRGVLVQRVGISIDHTRELLAATTLHGNLPEPLRLAHLIAGGVTTGASRGRA
jgi:endonuclease V-like protein UPF0215 family